MIFLVFQEDTPICIGSLVLKSKRLSPIRESWKKSENREYPGASFLEKIQRRFQIFDVGRHQNRHNKKISGFFFQK